MTQAPHVFDVLREWSELSDFETRQIFTQENSKTLCKIAARLSDGCSEKSLTVDSFGNVVKKLRALYVEGSRELSHAIIRATDFSEKGNFKDARLVYEEFIRKNPSPFYRAIANTHLQDLPR